MTSARGHVNVSFSDIAGCNMDMRLEYLVKKMTCQIHSKQTYKYFCETCDFLVCSDCLLEQSHFGHNKLQIEKFITEKFDVNSEDLPRTRSRTLNDTGCIDTMTDCPGREEKTEEGYENVEKMDGDNEKQNEEDFVHLEDSFCLLLADFKLIHTVTTNLPTVNFIAYASQDEAWIGGTDGNIICKVNINKTFFGKTLMRSNSKQLDQIEGFQPLDISVNTDGDILFVCRFDKCIKIMKTSYQGQKQVCDLQNFSPLEPICIHCSKGGDRYMWIGLTEGGPDFDLPKKSTRQVAEINETGEVCNIFEFTKANRRLFTLPWRIVNIGNSICVIDRLDQSNGRVISLDKSGHLMWIYKDPHPSFSKKAFLPTDLVVTSSKNIIICDFANSSLHILNEEGKLISHPNLINLNIYQPLSLNMDHSTSNLWIGSVSDSISKDKKAKIYEIEMYGV